MLKNRIKKLFPNFFKDFIIEKTFIENEIRLENSFNFF